MGYSSSGSPKKVKKKLPRIGLRFDFTQISVKYCVFYGILMMFVEIMQKFSPWEVVRHDIIYSVRFFGSVEVNPNGL